MFNSSFNLMRNATRIIIGLCLMAFLSSCSSKAENFKDASVAKVGNQYAVTLKGTRVLMAHDPVSMLIGGTYIDTETFQVPRIEGVVEGKEIPVEAGHVNYIGRIEFSGTRMKVELYYDYDKNIEPVFWNGEYNLVWSNAAKQV